MTKKSSISRIRRFGGMPRPKRNGRNRKHSPGRKWKIQIAVTGNRQKTIIHARSPVDA